ncbi:MAG: hypothetical protein KDK36_11560 [Leptospiraceae bacterium]|nr:hypothetical protein [Leptospiraceae bacterium]
MGGLGDVGGRTRNMHFTPEATIIRSNDYTPVQKEEVVGESSTYFFLGLIPLTNPLSIEYALSRAVEKAPGADTIVDLKIWHETHLFFPVGTVSVVKVKGLPVSLKKDFVPQPKKPDNQKSGGGIKVGGSNTGGGISVGGKKKKSTGGGISVGGKK